MSLSDLNFPPNFFTELWPVRPYFGLLVKRTFMGRLMGKECPGMKSAKKTNLGNKRHLWAF